MRASAYALKRLALGDGCRDGWPSKTTARAHNCDVLCDDSQLDDSINWTASGPDKVSAQLLSSFDL